MCLQLRREVAEQRRSEQHACDHLAYDLRLTETTCERAHDARRRQNDKHLEEERDGQLGSGHKSGYGLRAEPDEVKPAFLAGIRV